MHRFKMSCKDQRECVLDSLLCYCNVHLHHRNVFEIKLQDTQLDMIIRYDLIFKGIPVASEKILTLQSASKEIQGNMIFAANKFPAKVC